MDWRSFRLSKRLALQPQIIEEVYALLAEIDAVKSAWKVSGKLLPQSIQRLTHSVMVTSSGASNRIEGNLLIFFFKSSQERLLEFGHSSGGLGFSLLFITCGP